MAHTWNDPDLAQRLLDQRTAVHIGLISRSWHSAVGPGAEVQVKGVNAKVVSNTAYLSIYDIPVSVREQALSHPSDYLARIHGVYVVVLRRT